MANTLPPIPRDPIGENYKWREWFDKLRQVGFTTGGGVNGVTTFNARTGIVTLNSTDVTVALGYTPLATAVTTFNTRTGGIILTSADITGATGRLQVVRSSVSTPTTVPTTQGSDYIYLASGGITITLATALANYSKVSVKNADGSTIIVSGAGGQTIDGSVSVTLPIANMSLEFVSDGTNWRIF